jgi:hypothetical protein
MAIEVDEMRRAYRIFQPFAYLHFCILDLNSKTEHLYGEVHYAARKWSGPRRVVIKAEVVRAAGKDPKDNPRFVITNLKRRTPKRA